MMFNVMLSLSVEMDRLVIVSVRSVVEFIGGCVMYVVSIGFVWLSKVGGCFKCYDWFVWEDLFQMRVLLYRFPMFVYDPLYLMYIVTELCATN